MGSCLIRFLTFSRIHVENTLTSFSFLVQSLWKVAQNSDLTPFYQCFSDLVFPLFCSSCRISCFQSWSRWKSCHHLLRNTLVMLKTSDSQFRAVFMLFYAALFLLLHGTTAWSEVRKVKVYEQTSGPNWSQRDHRESEWVLSDEKEADVPASSVFIYSSLSPVLVSPERSRSRADCGSLPCPEQPRFITSALLLSLSLLPFDAIFLFLQRSPFIGLLQSRSNTFFYLHSFSGLNFRF